MKTIKKIIAGAILASIPVSLVVGAFTADNPVPFIGVLVVFGIAAILTWAINQFC